MYGSYDEVFDLKNADKNCVYNQIIDDNTQCHPLSMFDAQGDYQENVKPFPSERPIFEFKPYTREQLSEVGEVGEETFANIAHVDHPVIGGMSIQELKEAHSQPIAKEKEKEMHKDKSKEKSKEKFKEHFNGIPNAKVVDSSDIKDGVFVIFLGIVILLTIDIMVRLGRKL